MRMGTISWQVFYYIVTLLLAQTQPRMSRMTRVQHREKLSQFYSGPKNPSLICNSYQQRWNEARARLSDKICKPTPEQI